MQHECCSKLQKFILLYDETTTTQNISNKKTAQSLMKKKNIYYLCIKHSCLTDTSKLSTFWHSEMRTQVFLRTSPSSPRTEYCRRVSIFEIKRCIEVVPMFFWTCLEYWSKLEWPMSDAHASSQKHWFNSLILCKVPTVKNIHRCWSLTSIRNA